MYTVDGQGSARPDHQGEDNMQTNKRTSSIDGQV